MTPKRETKKVLKSKKQPKKLIQILLFFIVLGSTKSITLFLANFEIATEVDPFLQNLLFIVFFLISAVIAIILVIRYRYIWGFIALAGTTYLFILFPYEDPFGKIHILQELSIYVTFIFVILYIAKNLEILSFTFLIINILNFFLFGSVSAAVFFAVFLILVRIVYLLISQNYRLIARMGFVKFILCSTKSMVYMGVLLVLFLPGYYLVKKAQNKTMDVFYNEIKIKDLYKERKFSELPVEINLALESKLSDTKYSFKKFLAELKNKTPNTLNSLKNDMNTFFDNTIPRGTEIIPEKDYKFFDISAPIDRSIRKNLRNKICKERAKLKKEFEKKLYESIMKANNDVKGTIEEMEKNTDNYYKNLQKTRANIMSGIIFLYRMFSRIFNILFALLLIQSFVYIFSRISVKKVNNISATLNVHNKISQPGSIRICGQKYTISKQNRSIFYYKKRIKAFGCPPEIAIPQWKTSILPRIKSGVYVMKKVDISKNPTSVYFTTIGSNQFIEWNLKNNEEVVFKYSDLIAFSDSVKLKRYISLQITSLLLGGIFFKIAKGPGKIVLLSKGKPIICDNTYKSISVSRENILAWDVATQFDVDAKNNFANMFFSDFNLKRNNKAMLIFDADIRGKTSSGIVKFVKRFIIPW